MILEGIRFLAGKWIGSLHIRDLSLPLILKGRVGWGYDKPG